MQYLNTSKAQYGSAQKTIWNSYAQIYTARNKIWQLNTDWHSSAQSDTAQHRLTQSVFEVNDWMGESLSILNWTAKSLKPKNFDTSCPKTL